jgi:hypothetical protein
VVIRIAYRVLHLCSLAPHLHPNFCAPTSLIVKYSRLSICSVVRWHSYETANCSPPAISQLSHLSHLFLAYFLKKPHRQTPYTLRALSSSACLHADPNTSKRILTHSSGGSSTARCQNHKQNQYHAPRRLERIHLALPQPPKQIHLLNTRPILQLQGKAISQHKRWRPLRYQTLSRKKSRN